MRENLSKSLQIVFGHEGGYVNAKTDAGGPTKYGITLATLETYRKKPVAIADVRDLTLSEAEKIYRAFYWTQAGGDVLPSGLDYAVFDFGLHSGVMRAVKFLQVTLEKATVYNGEIDGHVGPKTLEAIKDYSGGIQRLIKDYINTRMNFLRSITNPKTGFPVNGRGWTIRVLGVDPLGKWRAQKGVIGHALQMSESQTQFVLPEPVDLTQEFPMQKNSALPQEPGLSDVIKAPEVLTGVGVVATGFTGMVAQSEILQFAVAALMIVGAAYIGYALLQRIKNKQARI